MSTTLPHVDAPAGPVAGSATGDVHVFRGIPYALSPTGEHRFAPPRPPPPWKERRDTSRPAAIAPQAPSRLKSVIGDFGGEQSEDCLSLTVWTPVQPAAPRAVMVWLHGGAYVSGGGALDCYSADELVRKGDVIVVAPNFRVGALGFLYLPGVSAGNFGLLDVALALRWVRDNIAAFGGDPSRVTVFGQSSGGSMVRALMAMPAADGLFQRAILQSAPLGRPDRDPATAAEIGRRFAGFLEVGDNDRAALERVPVSSILTAQGQLARSFAMPLGTNQLPFVPTVDGEVVLPDAAGNWFAACGHEVLVGYNAQELSAFHVIDPAVLAATPQQALASVQQSAGAAGVQAFHAWTEANPGGAAAALLRDFYTDRQFGAPAVAYAKSLTSRGVAAWVYRFDWQARAQLGACHCIELPFVFGNLPQWTGAQMVEGADPYEFAALADKVQRAWAAFARNGSPDHERLPHWPVLGDRQEMMVLDTLPALRPLPLDQ
jgi:para-nitrobenzyl esterase